MEAQRIVHMNGDPLILTGYPLKVGDRAPDFAAQDTNLSNVSLSSFSGKILVISAVPSLDTPVCDLQTRRFNQEAVRLGPNVVILTISMDLPFAQKRWCAATGVDRVITLSDHQLASFGKAYGVLIQDLRLLARAVFVVDLKGVIRYIELVDEITDQPNYEEVIRAVKEIR